MPLEEKEKDEKGPRGWCDSLGDSRACDRGRVGHRMDTPGRCRCIAIPVRNMGFLHKDMVLINSQERPGRVNLFLAVCLVVENHVSRSAPEVRANSCQSHVWCTELVENDHD